MTAVRFSLIYDLKRSFTHLQKKNMLLIDSLTLLIPLSIFAFVVSSKLWLLLLVGFLAMKFSRYGCGSCRHRSKLKKGAPASEKEDPYKEEDIVPEL